MERTTSTPPGITRTETERLVLRQWEEGDVENLWSLQSRAEMMRYFGESPYSLQQTKTWVDWHRGLWSDRGFSMWAADLKDHGFIGWVGLTSVFDPAELAGSVEVGWFIDPAVQRRGLATEGAVRSLEIGFGALGLERIIARCDSENVASEAVMRRAGMHFLDRGANARLPGRGTTVYEAFAPQPPAEAAGR